jgi:hypothetical protein
MKIEVPRNRSGSFEPLLIAKGQKRFEGFDEQIIAMYARGMTVREPERSGDRLPQAARQGEQSESNSGLSVPGELRLSVTSVSSPDLGLPKASRGESASASG